MLTDFFCENLADLDHVAAIQAIYCAWLQLNAMGERAEVDGTTYDNIEALERLAACLRQAGHIGF